MFDIEFSEPVANDNLKICKLPFCIDQNLNFFTTDEIKLFKIKKSEIIWLETFFTSF